jgi:hypothetical protein
MQEAYLGEKQDDCRKSVRDDWAALKSEISRAWQ